MGMASTGVQRDALSLRLHDLHDATIKTMDLKYFYPRGPVLAHGTDPLGSITIGVYEKMTIYEQLMEEISAFIPGEAKRRGIDPVAILFYKEAMPLANPPEVFQMPVRHECLLFPWLDAAGEARGPDIVPGLSSATVGAPLLQWT
jgi:hypothetical protein